MIGFAQPIDTCATPSEPFIMLRMLTDLEFGDDPVKWNTWLTDAMSEGVNCTSAQHAQNEDLSYTVKLYGNLLDILIFRVPAGDVVEINLDAAENVEKLSIINNLITTLPIANLAVLKEVIAVDCRISSFPVCPVSLITLYLYNNRLSGTIILPHHLKDVVLTNNAITEFRAVPGAQITDLLADANKIANSDCLTNMGLIINAQLSENKLTSINLSNNPELFMLFMPVNPMTTLDVAGADKLSELYVSDSPISRIFGLEALAAAHYLFVDAQRCKLIYAFYKPFLSALRDLHDTGTALDIELYLDDTGNANLSGDASALADYLYLTGLGYTITANT